MTTIDPKDDAVRRFASVDTGKITNTLDLIAQTATDSPIVVRSLIDAARPLAVAGARICELGFGAPGWLLEELRRAFPQCRLHGLDLSEPFARYAHEAHGADVRIMLGDMERLPFRDGSFDVIYSCWTLYFMRDIDAAIAGMRDALRPGGRFITATTARDHMCEYYELATVALDAVLGRPPQPDISDRFNAENGAGFMRRHFDDVTTVPHEGEMVLLNSRHIDLLWDAYGAGPLTPDERPAVIDALARLVDARIRDVGAFRMTRHGATFIGVR